MLKTLYVENFKSIGLRTAVELTPLTVFAGSNSSGKSTLLQSVLLLAQTAQSNVFRRPVVLNGSLTRLGTFSDILSARAKSPHISIGFDLQPMPEESRHLSNQRNVYFSEEQLRRTHCINLEMKFSGGKPGSGVAQLQPELDRVLLKYTGQKVDDEAAHAEVSLRRRRSDVDEFLAREKVSTNSISLQERASFTFEVEKPTSYKPRWGAPQTQTPKALGIHLLHFLPRWMTYTYDIVEAQCESIYRMFTSTSHAQGFDGSENLLFANPEASGYVLKLIRAQLEKVATDRGDTAASQRVARQFEELDEEFTAKRMNDFIANIPHIHRQAISTAFTDPSVKTNLFSILRRGRKEERKIGGGPLPEELDFSANYVQSFFSERIRYLGPLRDEPKPIYPYGGSIDSLDVGTKGESTAAVLDLHKDTEIFYIPSAAVKDTSHPATPIKATLLVAVSDWLQYMGVANHLHTNDQGKLGHELRVSTANSANLHDLTHVGVGVSQVLPILIQSLLVDPGSCLIFEQPELHLHPRVQTKLADFFLSVALLGKQCLIETHSEYLINELRYLSALAEGDNYSKLATVYFVRSSSDGSIYEPLKFNEFGAILNWPEGFFDESEDLSAEIIKAAMQKRLNKK
jgi:predicted ATPase